MTANERILAGLEEQPGALILRLDDGETLTVAPGAVPPQLLRVGASLAPTQLALLREAAARKLAARRLLALLDRRLDSRRRLGEKLRAEGFAPAAVEQVLDQAEAQGLCSDHLFAAAYCRDALRARTVGRLWLEHRLRAKGVPLETAREAAAAELPPDRERALCAEAARARWRRERGRDQRALARVQRFLLARGFVPQLASDAARVARPPA